MASLPHVLLSMHNGCFGPVYNDRSWLRYRVEVASYTALQYCRRQKLQLTSLLKYVATSTSAWAFKAMMQT